MRGQDPPGVRQPSDDVDSPPTRDRHPRCDEAKPRDSRCTCPCRRPRVTRLELKATLHRGRVRSLAKGTTSQGSLLINGERPNADMCSRIRGPRGRVPGSRCSYSCGGATFKQRAEGTYVTVRPAGERPAGSCFGGRSHLRSHRESHRAPIRVGLFAGHRDDRRRQPPGQERRPGGATFRPHRAIHVRYEPTPARLRRARRSVGRGRADRFNDRGGGLHRSSCEFGCAALADWAQPGASVRPTKIVGRAAGFAACAVGGSNGAPS